MGTGIDAELMRDIVGWDVRTWSTAVEFWNDHLGPTDAPLRCLEVGAGPGGPSLWLALQGHTVVCTNFQNTEGQARPLHDRYGVTGITYQDVDATAIPFENEFDLVIFKSVLGGVGREFEAQQRAMAGMLRALKPGGRLFFAENLRSTWFHRAARAIAYRIRGSSWRFMSVREMHQLLSGFREHELYTTGSLALFGVTEGQRGALAAVDDAFADRLTPPSWRYVSYGVATKG
ncbi:SAM-dependent methyltransferase [Microbacteriaceae bacterium SG_E_30_P1]|uniref:SAM-dependent methyltransferase n=1 Tax=Antiquaquibacter oligotrophicus TaxID=2880260 RepID=A0ABT6KK64_9MICO|nr:class I SAM-dependent methyltransferase [Antiquaquibacter oligotrophicus]MDH6180373.1 SAM-dependent methyltransferase [Antiquaquibacter oligotrophicus]UDF13885.1 class I SAM-dependent methyltransferase [Antiquaquibacter oligotrophicus]